MNFNRQQLSLISTVFSMAIVILILYSIQLGGKTEKDDDYVVEMILDEEILEELLEEEKINEAQSKKQDIKKPLLRAVGI